MTLTIEEDGWNASGEHAGLIGHILDTIRDHRGATRDILLGMQYDEWHARFGEEIPSRVMKTIEIAKKATCN